jgi:hypothetical protein
LALQGFESGPFPTTEASLIGLATSALEMSCERRRDAPTAEIPILSSVLLDTGTLVTTAVARDDRVAVLKALARSLPVFGFFIVADTFLHHSDRVTGRASKEEGLVAHLGTRELRLMMTRVYRRDGDRIVFDDPPRPVVNMRDPDLRVRDPYAGIFVSVPMPPAGNPS